MATTSNLQAVSTLTSRYQTTIPEKVRTTLGLAKGDRIKYTIANGRVILSPAKEEEDPVIGEFLNFLAQDMSQNPQHIEAIGSDLLNRTKSLVDDVEFDIDAPLSEEDE
ncbi:MAG: type II toxin-antitoxin system PrlF family antitoxin [Cyanobacteria bacterium P01_D01_bin.50]